VELKIRSDGGTVTGAKHSLEEWVDADVEFVDG